MDDAPPIPDCLDSAFREGPFERCAACDADLRAGGDLYHVQKTWRRGEVVFELALCRNCAEGTARDFSAESIERIRRWYLEHYRPSTDLAACHFCREPRNEEAGYEMAAACAGARLARPVVVMCAKCAESSQENLSAKTRRAWGDFMDRTLPGVPSEMEPERFPITF